MQKHSVNKTMYFFPRKSGRLGLQSSERITIIIRVHNTSFSLCGKHILFHLIFTRVPIPLVKRLLRVILG